MHRVLLRTAGICLASLALHAGSCEPAGSAEARKPNVLFLLSDDQRPDTIAALGNPYIRTPHLDALARRGVAFTRAVCANPICTPSRAEILSGCSGFRSGVTDFGGRLDPQMVLWPQAMQQAGYTCWYVGKWHNDGRPTTRGFTATRGLFRGGGSRWWMDQVDFRGTPVTGYRGWVFQDDQGQMFPEEGVGLTPNISSRFADAAIALIRTAGEQPFFLQVAFTAPHDPLLWPPGYENSYRADDMPLPPNFMAQHPFDYGNFDGRDEQLMPFPRTADVVRQTLAAYYAVISHMDAQIGRILAALEETGEADNTIVIFSSDHGLGLGSHGISGKQNMYEHTINVPLLIAGPGIPNDGRRLKAQAYLRDLYPTTCDLVGIDIPATVQGVSLRPVLEGQRDELHDFVFCHFRDSQRMVRQGNWKLIRYPLVQRTQLFDLENDPYELRNLAEHPAYADKLQAMGELMDELSLR